MSYFTVMTKSYRDDKAIEDVIKYIVGYNHEEHKCKYWGGSGILCTTVETAISLMKCTKRLWDKEDGSQLAHFVITIETSGKYDNPNIDFNWVKETEEKYCEYIAFEISSLIYSQGFQNLYAIHIDTDKIHIHYVINSVNVLNGSKLSHVTSLANMCWYYLNEYYRFLEWNPVKFNSGEIRWNI